MSFLVGAEAYDRFMGRYSTRLAPQLADLAMVRPGQTALDVGCGPGALTAELVSRLGPGSVSAADPSDTFVAAVRERYPEVVVAQAKAEDLPFDDDSFEVALAQLSVHFMTDPVTGIGEMARVTRGDGVVAACVWDHAGGHGPLNVFWTAARQLDPDVHDESDLPGTSEGHLGELFRDAGLRDVEDGVLTVVTEHATFDEWWEPYTLGVGPVGAHMAGLDPEGQEELRELCRQMLPTPPFLQTAVAWSARGVV